MGGSSRLSVALILVPVTFATGALAIFLLKFLGVALEPGPHIVVAIAAIMALGFWTSRRMGVSMDVFAVAVMVWVALLMMVMSVFFFFL